MTFTYHPEAHGSRLVGFLVSIALVLGSISVLCATCPAAEQINPYPRGVTRTKKVREWLFRDAPAGWKALHDCRLATRDGRLVITSTGNDPYLSFPVASPGGAIVVKFRAKCQAGGPGQLFWMTKSAPGADEKRSQRFDLWHDGKWHDYEVSATVAGTLTGFRLDPGSGPGVVEIERIELHGKDLHPLEIVRLVSEGRKVRLWVRNHSDRAVTFTVDGTSYRAEAGRTTEAVRAVQFASPFEAVTVEVRSEGLPPLRRTVHLYDLGVETRWLVHKSDPLELRIAPDASGAAVLRKGKPVVVISPLLSRRAPLPKLKFRKSTSGFLMDSKSVRILLEIADGNEVGFSAVSDQPFDGPAVRAIGALQQGLFAGLEYLGKGEQSSSTLDIETAEHVRYAPDPLKVTMPLMAVVTDRAAVTMTWQDMSLQPIFASPNFFDGTGDHRMCLRRVHVPDLRTGWGPGTSKARNAGILATIHITEPRAIEDGIPSIVREMGLPALPEAPRTRQQQWALALKSLAGPIAGEGGWGHCAEAKWPRAPYADVASTIWRLTGKAPDLPRLQPGGAHVRNDAIYFVTGRAEQWLKMRANQARGRIRSQRPDGSWRYEGTYRRGHFEDTASGFCARPAWELLEFAWCTGDKEALAAGVKALKYMKRFRTPRGAQTWELSLHTPDILASAYLVAAYVRGYELTGRKDYLAEARRWALSGVPFVYFWGKYPIMRYATVPVYGATNWRAPNWMGLPVQWCGGVYAYYLTKLAPYDKTLDWHGLAKGICLAGERMQYPDGPKVGCLPDVFYLASQDRAGPSINPCGMVSLRLALTGDVDSLAVAADDGRRVCGPFPVSIRDGKAHVDGKAGTSYQLLIDGVRIVPIQSKGPDVVDLPPAPSR